ncbi:MAG: SPFH domain-containing protein [Acidobacteria bacterium]|uniref:SPFH domain-containing protein n=1 Tax=Candidatus Polarisedimenticola svalbardensis TaxID=2886004 RepID=A0A8J6XVH5_9BACT|nr:SPFH domain-containing protein [Candidatus Polarisedimenticola svalbardensis]
MQQERIRKAISGYPMLLVSLLLLAGAVTSLVRTIQTENPWFVLPLVSCILLFILSLVGYFVVNPNDARVLVLFGTYKGTVKANGFYWANPFYTKAKITQRARNLNGEKLKVNDMAGNPIEIAAVVVWQVEDTFKASFDVDRYESYVIVQSEAAVRHLAGSYPYDTFEDDAEETLTLRAGKEKVSEELEKELSDRFERAGIKVIEARISHLAYAPEIAEAMLRRQQAVAVVAARTQIVEGAVSMVELALEKLASKKIVELDDERKATMVSNLLVVLCSESSATPVVNAGTLYQ